MSTIYRHCLLLLATLVMNLIPNLIPAVASLSQCRCAKHSTSTSRQSQSTPKSSTPKSSTPKSSTPGLTHYVAEMGVDAFIPVDAPTALGSPDLFRLPEDCTLDAIPNTIPNTIQYLQRPQLKSGAAISRSQQLRLNDQLDRLLGLSSSYEYESEAPFEAF